MTIRGVAVMMVAIALLFSIMMLLGNMLLKVNIDKPLVLDMLRGSYFISGDERPLKRIISVIHWKEDAKTFNEGVIGGAAYWSLESNARQHLRVKELCKKEIENNTGITKMLLEKIVDSIK